MPWFLLVLLLLIIGLLAGTNPSDAFQLVAPSEDAQLDTPLSVTLTWETCPGAASYRVELLSDDKAHARLAFESLTEPRLRLALCPDTIYEWRVWAITPTGEISSENEGRFTTADTKPEEVTDFVVMFAGVPPGEGYWEGLPRIPVDPDAELSPWFYKKSYDAAPPPSFESIRERLPQPIWDGHPDELRMYWYAWQLLFSPLWLFPPKEANHRAVSNLLGHYTWAGFGSTMVWDSAFILQFARYADHAYPVVTALDNCYARQHENGFICRESNASNIETWVIWPANPPLLPWSEWSVYQVSGDEERLRQVFLPLVKNYEWYMRYQRRADGLYWTRGEQEADDSPRNALLHSAVSTTAIQAMSAEQLAEMARIVGRPDLAAWFAAEAADLRQLVNDRFWDAEHSLYNDLGPDGKPVTVTEKGGVCKHGHIFWPLLAGCTDHKRGLAMARAAMDPARLQPTKWHRLTQRRQ